MPDKKRTVCFLTCSPFILKWRYRWFGIHNRRFRQKIRKLILQSIREGYTNFLASLFTGTDTLCIRILLHLKKEFPQITIEGIVCCDREKRPHRLVNQRLIKKCDNIQYIYDMNSQFYKRDQFMIRNAGSVIAIDYDKEGGKVNECFYLSRFS